MWLSQKGSVGLLNIQRENIVSSREKRRDGAWWYMIKPSLHLHQSPSIFFFYFQTIICNDLSVSLSFFFLAPEEGLSSKPKYRANLLRYIFGFIILFTYSSLCRKDHFADKNIACDQPALLFHRPPTFVLFPKNKSPDRGPGPSLEKPSLLDQVMWQRRFCKTMG